MIYYPAININSNGLMTELCNSHKSTVVMTSRITKINKNKNARDAATSANIAGEIKIS